jgi:transcriptional regulator with XRE-family HTH domain
VQRFNGHNLRAARKDADLKKEQLALLVGRSFEAVHLYECNLRRPPIQILERLAAVLDVDVRDFFDDEPVSA